MANFKLLNKEDIPTSTGGNSTNNLVFFKRLLEGKYLQANCGEVYKVVQYNNSKNIIVFFVFSGVEASVQLSVIKIGAVRPFKTNRRGARPRNQYVPAGEWLSDFKKHHGDKYDYSETVFKGSEDQVEVYCNIHKTKFQVKPSRHAKGGGICPLCLLDSSRKPFDVWLSSITDETNLCTKTVVPYGEWIGARSRVLITCCHGGDGVVRRADRLDILSDCKEHADKVDKVFNEISKEYAKRRRCFERKQSLLDYYSKQHKELQAFLGNDYTVCSTNIKTAVENGSTSKALPYRIRHKCGNEYTKSYTYITAANYGKGIGCPVCASWGYSFKDGSYFYILTSSDGLFKVGITKDITQRVRQINKRIGGKPLERVWSVLWCRHLEGDLRPVEKWLKEVLDSLYDKPTQRFDGFTESYILDGKPIPLPLILSAISF